MLAIALAFTLESNIYGGGFFEKTHQNLLSRSQNSLLLAIPPVSSIIQDGTACKSSISGIPNFVHYIKQKKILALLASSLLSLLLAY